MDAVRQPGSVLRSFLAERVVVCDGAMGTMLHAAGIPLDRWWPELNISRPDLVRDVHTAYARAGATILQTNTFGANRLRLAGVDPDLSVSEINIAGARLAKLAAEQAEHPVLVAGSVGPATSTSATGGHARETALREQIAALADWVDLLLLETFGDLESLVRAIELAKEESDLEIIAQLTFGPDRRTLRGEHPREVAGVLASQGVLALGANCTVGPAVLQDVVVELAAATTLPVSVQPNAGAPQRRGRQVRYARNAEYFGTAATAFAAGGAAIVGGCCGTTPAHITAIARSVDSLTPSRRRPEPEDPTPIGELSPIRLVGHAATGTVRRARPSLLPSWPAPDGFMVVIGLPVPRGDEVDEFVGHAERLLSAGADALAITTPRSQTARVNPIGAAIVLRERLGVEVMLPAEAADRSLAALQADLLGAHALGLRIVVCRTGTPFVAGDYPDLGNPWEVDSVGLIGALTGLNRGLDWRGVATDEHTRFVIGGSVRTWAADTDRELNRAEAKARAGAHFLVTDVIYDVERAGRFLRRLPTRGVDVPVLATLAPFDDVRTVEALSHETPEVAIPQWAIETIRSSQERPRRTIEIAVQTVEKLRDVVSGVVVRLPTAPDEHVVDLVQMLARTR
ncbi:MAG: bifunctional homocysteine S-methyltransferase/methylenetetrahydrofolate reductase [Egibacteraceae bacterium]